MTNIRQVLEALDFARREVFRTGSPDFLRARVGEDRVQRLCDRLIRGPARPSTRDFQIGNRKSKIEARHDADNPWFP